MTRPAARRLTAAAFAGFFLLAAAWALALPRDANTDENAHVERAYGVATGQLFGKLTEGVFHRPAVRVEVPADLIARNEECAFSPVRRAADCLRFPASRRLVAVDSYVGRYSPVYYLPVGLPLALDPGRAGFYAARLVSAAWCAALFAAALALAVRSRARLGALAVLLAATPTAVNMAGAVNPSGVEIAAGTLWWTGALALLGRLGGAGADGPLRPGRSLLSPADTPLRRRAATGAAVGGALLATVRPAGAVWLLLSCGCLLALAGRAQCAAAARAAGRSRVAVLAAAAVAGPLWNLAAHGYSFSRSTEVQPWMLHRSTASLLSTELRWNLGSWVQECVGVAGHLDTFVQPWPIALWFAPAAVLAGLAALGGTRRELLALAAAAAAPLLAATAIDLHYYRLLGWSQDGRYLLPSLAGVGLIAAGAAARHRLPDRGRAGWPWARPRSSRSASCGGWST